MIFAFGKLGNLTSNNGKVSLVTLSLIMIDKYYVFFTVSSFIKPENHFV